jgi:LPXTG-motif cell wall-anchored protein
MWPAAPPVSAAPADQPAGAVPAVPPVACDAKDSPGKGWIQVFYVYRVGQNRFDELRGSVQRLAWDVDQTFDASARRLGHGDSRRLRLVQSKDCRIEVTPIGLTGLLASTDTATVGAAVRKAVLTQVAHGAVGWFTRHKPLYYVDIAGASGCGIGGGSEPGGLGEGFGMATFSCWDNYAMTHELIHGFGIPHCSADHAEGNDPMCRDSDPTPRCTDVLSNFALDCPGDDFAYFDPRPAPHSALAADRDRNIADSAYLIKDQPTPPMDVRMVGLSTGRCLAAAGPDEPCSAATTWHRTIGDDGYLRLEAKGTGRCLASSPSDPKGVTMAACDKGDESQDWWMADGIGPRKAGLQLINRTARRRMTSGADGGSYEMVPVGARAEAPTAPAPSDAPAAPPAASPAPMPDTDDVSTPAPATAAPTTAPGNAHLATTGAGSGVSLPVTAGAVTLLVAGAALLFGFRRKRASASSRHAR